MIIGIDLGTTNSLVSYWTQSGSVMIPNAFNENLTPSCVGVDDEGHILIGKVAKEYQITRPERCAAIFKRYMGSQKTWKLNEQVFLPEELSSLIIKSLKADAEHFLGMEITEAVISVPAYFSDAQRKATLRAGELAGLKVERMISEPTAAAIAYGIHERHGDTRFLVVDLGGGTFDVSILDLFNGIMEVRAVAGDNFLGGEDFTELIVQHFLRVHQKLKHQLTGIELAKLRKEAEVVKRQLGLNETVTMTVGINDAELSTELSVSQFEALSKPLLSRIKTPIERALRDSDLSVSELDGVILVGGATKMPMIRTFISKLFGKMPYITIDPDEVVAQGAAVQAALKGKHAPIQEVILTDVCPYTLGTNVSKSLRNGGYESGHFLPIIERNTIIPVSRVERLNTVHDLQKELRIQILQGESRLSKDNILLGELFVAIPPKPAGEECVDVRYTYDINGILEVAVHVLSTGFKRVEMISRTHNNMTKDEIKSRFEELSHLKIHPREAQENLWLIAKGERLYEEYKGEMRDQIAGVISDFEAVLDTQDLLQIRVQQRRVADYFDQIDCGGDF